MNENLIRRQSKHTYTSNCILLESVHSTRACINIIFVPYTLIEAKSSGSLIHRRIVNYALTIQNLRNIFGEGCIILSLFLIRVIL